MSRSDRVQLVVGVPTATLDRLRELSKASFVPITEIVRRALDEYLPRLEARESLVVKPREEAQ